MVIIKMADNVAHNFIELSRWPRKMDCKTLFSLVVSASKIVPKSCQMSIKRNIYGDVEDIALLEFHTEADAVKTMDKLSRAVYAKNWNMTIIGNPLESK